jgi:phosphatidylinositol glycan class B
VLIWIAVGTLALTRLTLDGQSPLTTKTILILVREAVLCGYVPFQPLAPFLS